jgi:acetyl-CoA carboxylase biotin carboxyl carrier protein
MPSARRLEMKTSRMDLKLIQRLIKMMQGGGVVELELEDPKSGSRIRLKRAGEAPPPQQAPLVHLMHGAPPVLAPTASAAPAATPAEAAPAPVPQGKPILSPMVGTFYRTPSPESEPFVQVGSRIAVDSALCIIEAMKVMNEIKSEVAGEILAILVENGEPVEFGQPLFLVKPA